MGKIVELSTTYAYEDDMPNGRTLCVTGPKDTVDHLLAKDQLITDLVEAGNRLSFMAQTSGGTAGRDAGLVAAIGGWAAAIARAEGR